LSFLNPLRQTVAMLVHSTITVSRILGVRCYGEPLRTLISLAAPYATPRTKGPSRKSARPGALLDGVLVDYEVNQRGSLDTARARLRILREAIGTRAAVTFTTEDVQRLQVDWRRGGLTAGTINRRLNFLRKAFRLAWKARKIAQPLYVPTLDGQA